MRSLILLSVLFACSATSQAHADGEPFDVPNGQVQTQYSGALVPDTLVSCEFSIDEAFFGSQWLPMVAILFNVDGETHQWANSLKLTAIRFEETDGWRHELIVSHVDERESTISMRSEIRKDVLPLYMWWKGDQTIIVFVGDDPSHMSVIDVSEHSFSGWEANVSGVKGRGDCDSRVLSDDGEDMTAGSAP